MILIKQENLSKEFFDLVQKEGKGGTRPNLILYKDGDYYNFIYLEQHLVVQYKRVFRWELEETEKNQPSLVDELETICFTDDGLSLILQLLALGNLDSLTLSNGGGLVSTIEVTMIRLDGVQIKTIASRDKDKDSILNTFDNVNKKIMEDRTYVDVSKLTSSIIVNQLLLNLKSLFYIMRLKDSGKVVALVNDSDLCLTSYELDSNIIDLPKEYTYQLVLNKSVSNILLNNVFNGSKLVSSKDKEIILKYETDCITGIFQYFGDTDKIMNDDVYTLYNGLLDYNSTNEFTISVGSDEFDTFLNNIKSINYNLLDRKLVWTNNILEMLSLDNRTKVKKEISSNINDKIIINYDDFLNFLNILNSSVSLINRSIPKSKSKKNKEQQDESNQSKEIILKLDLGSSAGVYFNFYIEGYPKITSIFTNLNS